MLTLKSGYAVLVFKNLYFSDIFQNLFLEFEPLIFDQLKIYNLEYFL